MTGSDTDGEIQAEWKKVELSIRESTRFTREAVGKGIDRFAIWLRGVLNRRHQVEAGSAEATPAPTPPAPSPAPTPAPSPAPTPTRPTVGRPPPARQSDE